MDNDDSGKEQVSVMKKKIYKNKKKYIKIYKNKKNNNNKY